MRKPIFTREQLEQATELTMDSFQKFATQMPPPSAFEEEAADRLAPHWDGVEPAKLRRALALMFARAVELRASFITACVVLHDRSISYLEGLDKFADYSTEFAAIAEARNEMIDLLKRQINQRNSEATERARKAANALHDVEGGSRDLQKAIRDAWLTGKFSSRDECAEKKGSELKMPFSTARKALRNTPEPPNWTARPGSKRRT